MASKLSDIRPGANDLGEGVSLVHRGANRRRFLLAKTEGELDADVAEILAAPVAKEAGLLDVVRATGGDESVEKAAATAARALSALQEAYADAAPEVRKAMQDACDGLTADEDEPDEDDVAKAYDEVCKADFTAEQRAEMAKNGEALPDESYPIPDRDYLEKAIHAVGRGTNNSHTAIREHIVKRARALGATSLLPDTWNIEKEDGMTETAQAVPVKKEDGSWDLSAVPEDQRPALELVLKAHEDEVTELRKAKEAEETKAEEALKIAKAEQESRLTREYVAKSAELDKLAKDDSEFGPVLRDIAKAEADKQLPEGTLEKLETVLKAANEAVQKGDLFTELGRTGSSTGGDAMSKLDAAAAELRKSDSKLSKEQAVAKALDNDPALYDEYRKAVA